MITRRLTGLQRQKAAHLHLQNPARGRIAATGGKVEGIEGVGTEETTEAAATGAEGTEGAATEAAATGGKTAADGIGAATGETGQWAIAHQGSRG